MQRRIAPLASHFVTNLIGAPTNINKVNFELFNKLSLSDVLIKDLKGDTLLKANRISAGIQLFSLLKNKISFNTIQLFSFDIRINQDSIYSPLNIQPIIDKLSSEDTTTNEINLAIRSIQLRKGKLSFDILSEDSTPEEFNIHHFKTDNLFSAISIKTLHKDSVNIHCNRFSLEEQSGFILKNLSFKLIANRDSLQMNDFKISMPNSQINLDTLLLNFDSIQTTKDLFEKTKFQCNVSSTIALKDLSAFIPAFSNFQDQLFIKGGFSGTLNDIICKNIRLSMDNGFELSGKAELIGITKPEEAYIYGILDRCKANTKGIQKILQNFTSSTVVLPQWAEDIGNINFKGSITGFFSELVAYGELNSKLGKIRTDLMISHDTKKQAIQYSGSIDAQEINFTKLSIQDNPLGKAGFHLDLNAEQVQGDALKGNLKASISNFELNQYIYQLFTFEGNFDGKGFEGVIHIDDPNLQFTLNGTVDTEHEISRFFFDAWLDKLDLTKTNLTKDKEDNVLSLYIHSHCTGNSIEDMNGILRFDNISYQKGTKKLFLDSILIQSQQTKEYSTFKLNSKYIKGNIFGKYSFKTLRNSIISTIGKYIPALHLTTQKVKSNDFSFYINLFNTEDLSSIFNLPITVFEHGYIEGNYAEKTDSININGYMPHMKINSFRLKGSSLSIQTSMKENLAINIHTTNVSRKGKFMNLYLNTLAKSNQLETELLWSNSSERTFSGDLKLNTQFYERGKNSSPNIAIHILPTNMILNDTIWSIDQAMIRLDSGKVNISNIALHQADQFIRMNGNLSNKERDTLKLDLKDINLDYIFTMVNLSHLGFGGLATGNAMICNAFEKPQMNAKLDIQSFAFNKERIGDLGIKGSWTDSIKGIYLDGDIKDLNHTLVKGHIFPLADSLDLNIKADKLNIGFIHPFTQNFLSELSGKATGLARLYGNFSSITTEGNLYVDNAKIGIDFLNTTYTLNDTIRLNNESIEFNNITLIDAENNTSTLNGIVTHHGFKDISYDIAIRTNNMLLYNTQKSEELPFWGKIYGTGSTTIRGSKDEPIYISVDMTMNRSRFYISLDNSTDATEYEFITFIDRKKEKENKLAMELFRKETEALEKSSNINLSMQMDINPETTIQVIMDEETNDIIETRGNGDIRIEYKTNNNDIKMFGKYMIEDGYYNYSFLGAQDKRFKLRDGSSISFNGTPLNAELGITAYYSLTAFLGDLDDSFLTESSSRNTMVNCMLNINGALQSPTILFDIELPNAGEDIQRKVENIINSDEMMNRQMLYLLVFNQFYTPDYMSASQRSNELISGASSTISGLLNSALSGVLAENWTVGTNIRTNDLNFTDVDMQVALSSRLLDNRLLFNGNFGYRDNLLNSSTFIGDFDIEYKLTRNGNLRLKVYNKANEKYYLKSGQNTQGLGVIYKKDFNSWKDFFRINPNKKVKKEEKK